MTATSSPPAAVEHRVKIATTVKAGRGRLYVWECSCGYSSPLCEAPWRANELFEQHKAESWSVARA